jgi:hypothetical protein
MMNEGHDVESCSSRVLVHPASPAMGFNPQVGLTRLDRLLILLQDFAPDPLDGSPVQGSRKLETFIPESRKKNQIRVPIFPEALYFSYAA